MCALPRPDSAPEAAEQERELRPRMSPWDRALRPTPAPGLRPTASLPDPDWIDWLAMLLCLALLAWPIVWLLMEVL